jgi:CopG family nickel-responsive transcriptional regulator
MERTSRCGVSLPARLLLRFDRLIGEKGYSSRSEAFRDLMREYVVSQEWERGEEVVATVTIVFDHDAPAPKSRILRLQHDHHGVVLSSMHLHLDSETCLEVIVLRGRSSVVRACAERIISTKGVRHGKMITTTMGKKLE